jgi:hypothetical protein
MKIKTEDLISVALDWAVAKAENYADAEEWKVCTGAKGERYLVARRTFTHWPSRSWEQGGPIIERERIEVTPPISRHSNDQEWMATNIDDSGIGNLETGPTPLIAAMRCFVASKLGDEVDIPEELT